MSELHAIADLAEEMARGAGAIQRERYETKLEVRTKSAAIDLVTEVDQACEALIIEAIERHRPGDAILAEEGGGQDFPEAEWRWIVDPLDGTTNYAHGYPRFCVSIGIEHRGQTAIGVVYDPIVDEMYRAIRGEGAQRNGTPIHTSSESDLSRALIATGFAYDVRRSENDNLNHFASFVKTARALRRDGSAALDLCYVASGRLDGFWELTLHPWDVAAGNLMVEEAGGRVSDLAGGPALRSGRETVASNGPLHDAMLALLATPPTK
ncbi:inositol monophosphatase [Myxococcota bacterium]|nr:inositol monophosphatase [Myxococcota bacterium]